LWYSNLNPVYSRPSGCSANTDALTYKRRIAYYELFTKGRSCGVKEPEELPLAPLTHLNLAFVNFGPDFKLIDDNPDWVRRTALMKLKYPALRINIAVGGWAFNDPPTTTYFSDMAGSYENRRIFVKSVVDFLRTYGLDGIDIDWEYPAATDRGGEPLDSSTYVSLVADLREAFDKEGSDWEISCAIPSSYWYLRGYKLESMQKYINYFNLMSYDIYGVWDQENEWTGPYLKGHTDWSEIDRGLDLLWRNGVKPEQVVLGMGFYGRSFTMESPNCFQPNGECQFSDGGQPGSCTDTVGVLAYYEIQSRNTTLDVQTYYDAKNTVKYNVFGGSQWVSYDDSQSWHDKKALLSARCLSGIMIWAIDQDTGNFDAMSQLFGDYSGLELDGLDNDSAEKLSDLFGQFTGQDCFVTERCTKDGDGEKGKDQVCPAGFQSVSTAHNPYQKAPHKLSGDCDKGWYRHICCPKTSMPKSCEWYGEPVRSVIGCTGHCGEGTFELNQDTAADAKGTKMCYQGTRKLCCKSTKLIDDCFWNTCQGPLAWQRDEAPQCPENTDIVAWRYNKPDGTGLCREEYVSPVDGKKGSPLTKPFRSPLCCPKGRGFDHCRWSNNPVNNTFSTAILCLPSPCGPAQVQIESALDPPEPITAGTQHDYCPGVQLPPNTDPHYPLCCDPPSIWNKDWPVSPDRLWEIAYADKDKDKAVWTYDTQYGNNDADGDRADPTKIDGSDSYGFLMLNGHKEAIDDTFAQSHTVVRRTAEIPHVKREIITNNKTLLDSVFDHVEETFYAYCNYPAGDDRCAGIWAGGVEDTIIRLPNHIGEGPFARVVSMDVAEDYNPGKHHLVHRSTNNIEENPIYRVKIDYNFHLARQDRGNVNIRIDYTNLLGYWKELTDSEPDKSTSRIKRGIKDEGFSMSRFREHIQRGEKHETTLRKRREPKSIRTTVPFGNDDIEFSDLPVDAFKDAHAIETRRLDKRWWGVFMRWLEKLTTVRKAEKGDLPLGWADTINIFRATWGCPGKAWSANLRLDLEADVSMQATYAYYFSTTFIPPVNKPDVFFYFGIEPTGYVGLKMVGNAAAHLTTGRKKIIDTLSYPGLAVKGIASVGPTLDVYGEVRGDLNIHGEMKAGARITFPKSQVYWPQDEDKLKDYDDYLDLDLKSKDIPKETEIAPTFEAGVQVTAAVAVIVQPEVHVGITVGGSQLTGGVTLISATVSAFMKAALQFMATGNINLVTSMFDYEYGAYLYFNLGYKAQATVLNWFNWALSDRNAYTPDRKINIYGPKSGSISLVGDREGDNKIRRRMVKLMDSTDEERERFDNETMSALADPAWLFRRADGDGDKMDVDGPNAPSFTQPITCPAGDSAPITIPELRCECSQFEFKQPPSSPFLFLLRGMLSFRSFSMLIAITNSQLCGFPASPGSE
jgi:chitinase